MSRRITISPEMNRAVLLRRNTGAKKSTGFVGVDGKGKWSSPSSIENTKTYSRNLSTHLLFGQLAEGEETGRFKESESMLRDSTTQDPRRHAHVIAVKPERCFSGVRLGSFPETFACSGFLHEVQVEPLPPPPQA